MAWRGQGTAWVVLATTCQAQLFRAPPTSVHAACISEDVLNPQGRAWNLPVFLGLQPGPIIPRAQGGREAPADSPTEKAVREVGGWSPEPWVPPGLFSNKKAMLTCKPDQSRLSRFPLIEKKEFQRFQLLSLWTWLHFVPVLEISI